MSCGECYYCRHDFPYYFCQNMTDYGNNLSAADPPHRNRSLDRLLSIIGDSGARTVLCTAAVRDYLKQLAALCGQEVEPARLLPRLKPHAIFRGAYPIPGADLYLSLDEGEPTAATARTAEVQILCDGPNLGSAGGPTLQPLGAIGRVEYVGVLAS